MYVCSEKDDVQCMCVVRRMMCVCVVRRMMYVCSEKDDVCV